MEIILLEGVKALGKRGQIIRVNESYAKNFILPKRPDVEAAPKNLNSLKLQRANMDEITAEQLAAAKKLGEKLEKSPVTLSIRAEENGRALGSVSSKEIGRAITEQLELDIDKKKLVLPEPLRTFGTHEVPAKLHKNITAKLAMKVAKTQRV